MKKIPIVITAFGTTTKAKDTYDYMDKIIRERFFDHKIEWAYSSRLVRDFSQKKNVHLKSPQQILSALSDEGYPWAVVQSLHLLCGHEFYRLVEEVSQSPVRTSMGLPLLSDPEDYEAVTQGVGSSLSHPKNEATVLVGHGTDHPAWTSYIAMSCFLKERYGPNLYVGAIGGHPSREDILRSIKQAGIKKVHLIPFMLVAGRHVQEDLMENTDSWKASFAQEGISVSVEDRGLGFNPRIVEIFLEHIEAALDIIPTAREVGIL
ncbi:sirohydrochlorin cobaltochelatase [Thermodesulfovibrionales bacterium]|nr:sirohydrochlorin cobaltochelatase [Thermodesulfovibrionales bacterium]